MNMSSNNYDYYTDSDVQGSFYEPATRINSSYTEIVDDIINYINNEKSIKFLNDTDMFQLYDIIYFDIACMEGIENVYNGRIIHNKAWKEAAELVRNKYFTDEKFYPYAEIFISEKCFNVDSASSERLYKSDIDFMRKTIPDEEYKDLLLRLIDKNANCFKAVSEIDTNENLEVSSSSHFKRSTISTDIYKLPNGFSLIVIK